MRYALALAMCALSCAAEPVLLPDASTPDAGPCGGACGAGTSCVSGACVAIDAGRADAGALDAGAVDSGSPVDVGEDRPAPVDVGTDSGAADTGEADAGLTDAGPMDVLPSGCLSTTPGNCCGVACRVPSHGFAACLGGRCVVGSCEANYGDCDGDPANGCEVDTRATTAHRGACGAACAAGRMCIGSACVNCPPLYLFCGGICVSPVSVQHCGACDRGCSAGPHVARMACRGGSCAIETCAPGYVDADRVAANGCERPG